MYNKVGDDMTVKKFNYFRFISFIVVLILIVVGIVIGIKTIKKKIDYTKTDEYLLINYGFNEEDAKYITKNLDKNDVNKLLKMEYNPSYIYFIKQKYFILENIEKYVEYKRDNISIEYSEVISIINTESNVDWIDNEKETDTSKNELMLVNRLYGLSKDYEVKDIVSVPVKYAYDGNKLSNIVLDNLIELIEAGKEAGYTFVVNGSYRSYSEQEKLYNYYVNSSGRSEADKIVARPGHSEYETGLSFDLVPYNKSYEDPKSSDENKWLRENAYKYGFIFRFDKDKEKLTGFGEYPWRLRYVGEKAAKIIFDEKLCFEEYYAYYVRGNK